MGTVPKEPLKSAGMEDISKRYGVPFTYLKDDGYIAKTYKGIEISICKTVPDLNYLINVFLDKRALPD